MRSLVIVGARAMGRETCVYAQDAGWQVKGFLDDNPDALDGFGEYPQILASVENYRIAADDVFVVALGEPEYRQKYVEMVSTRGGKFVSIIHPRAYLGRNLEWGTGCVICPNATVSSNVFIGNHVIVNVNASINHDSIVRDYSTLSPGCHIAGRVVLGASVFVGIGASVIPDVTIGDGVFVAAGAVVVGSVTSGRVMGIPAREK